MYTMSQKNCHRFFRITLVKREPISIIFGIKSPEETLHQMVVNLSTLPEYVAALPCEFFSKYITHMFPSILAIFQ